MSILFDARFAAEAAYVLDGLFDHDTILDIEEHFTDTGAASDHVFALFALIGKRFAPRLRNLKDRKFHIFEKADTYPALADHIGVQINTALIMEYWDDLLHLAASIRTRTVAPSTGSKSWLHHRIRVSGQGPAGTRPYRTILVHDRVVFQSSPAPAMPGRSQQGRGSTQTQACRLLP